MLYRQYRQCVFPDLAVLLDVWPKVGLNGISESVSVETSLFLGRQLGLLCKLFAVGGKGFGGVVSTFVLSKVHYI